MPTRSAGAPASPARFRVVHALLAGSLIVVCALPGGQLARAQSFDANAIDAWVVEQMSRHGIPGVAVAVTDEGTTVFAKGWGTAGSGRPLTPDTPMYIGSTSKAFTGLAVMQLVERGMIDLDAPVRTYLPWFDLADEAAAEQITVRHLLGHASGLSDLQYVDTWRVPDDATIEEGVRDLARARPIDPPGTTFHYFNPGYAALGLIVETVSGQSYADYLRTHILEPLGMHRTFMDPADATAAGLARGHTLLFGFPVGVEQPFRRYALPAGYVMSTANDLARYLAAMAHGGDLDGARILSLAGMMQLHAPTQPSGFYAMGWFVGEHRGMRLVQHGGSNEFFKSEAMILPDRDLGLVVLIDQWYLPSALHAYPRLAYGLLDIVAGLEPAEPGWPMRWFGWALLGLAVVQLGLFGRAVGRLRAWSERVRRWRPLRRWFDVGLHIVLMPAIAFGIVVAMRVYMGRGTSLLGAFAAVPDAALLALFAYAADLGQAAFKIVATVTRRAPPHAPRERARRARTRPEGHSRST